MVFVDALSNKRLSVNGVSMILRLYASMPGPGDQPTEGQLLHCLVPVAYSKLCKESPCPLRLERTEINTVFDLSRAAAVILNHSYLISCLTSIFSNSQI